MKKMRIKFLGTSSGEKIPRDDNCPQCDSNDKKDQRLRSSILINKKILVDAGPDILEQLTPAQIKLLDVVLITHEHADHVAGLKEVLRANKQARIIKLKAGEHFKMTDISFHAFKVRHSNLVPTVGMEINEIIYIPDYADLDQAKQYLQNARLAILDGSSLNRTFGGHLSMNETIAFVKPLKNLRKIYFTHNGHTHLPHKELQKIVRSLGDGRFFIAYDGLELEI